MTKDPVCGMRVEPQKTEFKSLYQEKTYYFWLAVCKGMFDRDPQKYIDVSSDAQPKG
jgi:YHS domain-containing protein